MAAVCLRLTCLAARHVIGWAHEGHGVVLCVGGAGVGPDMGRAPSMLECLSPSVSVDMSVHLRQYPVPSEPPQMLADVMDNYQQSGVSLLFAGLDLPVRQTLDRWAHSERAGPSALCLHHLRLFIKMCSLSGCYQVSGGVPMGEAQGPATRAALSNCSERGICVTPDGHEVLP